MMHNMYITFNKLCNVMYFMYALKLVNIFTFYLYNILVLVIAEKYVSVYTNFLPKLFQYL